MSSDHAASHPSTPLVVIDGDRSAGPSVTPEPAPSDDTLVKLIAAAAVGAIIGSYAAYRFLRRFVGFLPRSDR